MQQIIKKYIFLVALSSLSFECMAGDGMTKVVFEAVSSTEQYSKSKAMAENYVKNHLGDYQIDKIALIVKVIQGDLKIRSGKIEFNTNIRTQTFSIGATYDF